MGISTITTGGAHSSEKQSKYGVAGDQLQSAVTTSDYSGEVSLRNYSESAFKSRYSGYTVYRPSDPNAASAMANLMIRACNNPHIGYSQDTRQGIFEHGVDSTVNINCDCSSLVSYCITQGMGVNVNTNTSGLGLAMTATGKFMSPVSISNISFSSNPPYNGDIILKAGSHVEMVVSGNSRTGKGDEITGSTWSGIGEAVQGYTDSYGIYAVFDARKTAPNKTDEFYNQSYGFNENGSYAWGRFSEIMQSTCNLARGQVKTWYNYKEDGYSRNTAPALGSVMCYINIYDNDDPGTAYIVEEIQPDYIYVSYKDRTTKAFKYEKMTKRNGSWNMDLDNDGRYETVLQGFIYNPSVDTQASTTSALQTFIQLAEDQVGDSGGYVTEQLGMVTTNIAWGAPFVMAVAKQTGSILNIIIPNTYSCSEIGRIGVVRNMGSWYDGPALGGQARPEPGDLALFRFNVSDKSNKYAADAVGIVVEVSGNNANSSYAFTVVMGNCDGKVRRKIYTTQSASFSGVFRPYWEQIDGTTSSVRQYYDSQGIYTEGTSLEDAAIRDLRYVTLTDSGFEPSIQSKGMLLCAINYTGMLANLYSALVEVGTSDATDANLIVDLWNNSVKSDFQTNDNDFTSVLSDSALGNVSNSTLQSESVSSASSVTLSTGEVMKMNSTARSIYQLLNAKISNPAGTIGIMANMYQESRWNCAAVNSSSGASGLIQWLDTTSKYGESKRCTNMKEWCRKNGNNNEWSRNLSGQISFLFHEAETESQYRTGMTKIKAVANTEEGAKLACKLFLDYFEIGWGNVGTDKETKELSIRYPYAVGAWKLFFGGQS